MLGIVLGRAAELVAAGILEASGVFRVASTMGLIVGVLLEREGRGRVTVVDHGEGAVNVTAVAKLEKVTVVVHVDVVMMGVT